MYGHVITKFSRIGCLPHFLTHAAPLRASGARAPLLDILVHGDPSGGSRGGARGARPPLIFGSN